MPTSELPALRPPRVARERARRAVPARVARGVDHRLASVDAAWSPKTRAIVVVSPNNPTGSMLRARERDGSSKLVCGACAAASSSTKCSVGTRWNPRLTRPAQPILDGDDAARAGLRPRWAVEVVRTATGQARVDPDRRTGRPGRERDPAARARCSTPTCRSARPCRSHSRAVACTPRRVPRRHPCAPRREPRAGRERAVREVGAASCGRRGAGRWWCVCPRSAGRRRSSWSCSSVTGCSSIPGSSSISRTRRSWSVAAAGDRAECRAEGLARVVRALPRCGRRLRGRIGERRRSVGPTSRADDTRACCCRCSRRCRPAVGASARSATSRRWAAGWRARASTCG